jgi:Uma2 family endonuclease
MMPATEFDPMAARHPVKRGEPVWDLALLFPPHGEWTEDQYLALDTNKLIEFVDGCLEFLPIPTLFHQGIVRYLFALLNTFVVSRGLGEVFFAPLRVRLWEMRIREPDVVFIKPHRIKNRRRPPEGADLAIEVVSEGDENRERDLHVKRREYAKAGIQEYWIVDPQEQRITVLTLDGSDYRVHGEFGPGMQATSVALPGFAVDVSETFAAGEGPQGATTPNDGQ